jgi:hypothetical protein
MMFKLKLRDTHALGLPQEFLLGILVQVWEAMAPQWAKIIDQSRYEAAKDSFSNVCFFQGSCACLTVQDWDPVE